MPTQIAELKINRFSFEHNKEVETDVVIQKGSIIMKDQLLINYSNDDRITISDDRGVLLYDCIIKPA